ncbi:MAG: glycosyltransferase family 2 protein [bacterium]|nr:glycosyltransferase family 2 protein [bacterium]
MIKLSVIIPTYNRKDYLYRLLGQLRDQELDTVNVDMSVVVVVDGAGDGTIEMLAAEFPHVDMVRGDGDWWWTKSINEGCKHAVKNGAEAVLLLNDDTGVRRDYIRVMLKNAELQPGAVIGSLDVTKETPHRMYFSGVKKITWWNAKSHRYYKAFEHYDETLTGLHESVILMGRGLFIPVPVFEKTGFLDEKAFPQYKADVDFVLTAHEKNIETFISWDSVLYVHMGTTGKGVTYTGQSFWGFLGSFFGKNTCNNLLHSFRYYRKHCRWYLLPLSFTVDKMRLIYSYWSKRKLSKQFYKER